MTAAKTTTRLNPDAASLIQLIRHNLVKALNAMPGDDEEATLSHLHAITGPILRSATAIKRANTFQKTTAQKG